jgi:hypothetical protein
MGGNWFLVVVLLLGILLFLAKRKGFADSLYRYYQDIYEPTGPWWRNGAWRPSRRLTGLIVDAFIVLLVILEIVYLWREVGS